MLVSEADFIDEDEISSVCAVAVNGATYLLDRYVVCGITTARAVPGVGYGASGWDLDLARVSFAA